MGGTKFKGVAVQPNQAQKHRLPLADIPFRMPGLRDFKSRAFFTSKQTGVTQYVIKNAQKFKHL